MKESIERKKKSKIYERGRRKASHKEQNEEKGKDETKGRTWKGKRENKMKMRQKSKQTKKYFPKRVKVKRPQPGANLYRHS